MRARKFYNTPDDPTISDTGTDTSGTNDTTSTDDPGRTDTDTVPKKKAE